MGAGLLRTSTSSPSWIFDALVSVPEAGLLRMSSSGRNSWIRVLGKMRWKKMNWKVLSWKIPHEIGKNEVGKLLLKLETEFGGHGQLRGGKDRGTPATGKLVAWQT